MKQTVILLHGEPGAGKDAIAAHLVDKYGFLRLAFADKLKEMCEALDPFVGREIDMDRAREDDLRWQLNGIPPKGDINSADFAARYVRPVRLTEVVAQLGWDLAKRAYPEVRRTQQRLGTEVIRRFVAETFWADVVARQARDVFPQPVVVTDMRFQSELDVMSTLDDVRVWWVKRPDNPYRIEGDNAAHVSEQWHPPEYSELINDFEDLPGLHKFVDWWMAGLATERQFGPLKPPAGDF